MKKLLLAGILSVIFFAGCAQQTPTKNLDSFAQCLTKAGATMYGLETCSHCQQQKAMFGTSFQYVTYVNCAKEPTRCTTFSGVPTREFKDKSTLAGVQELSTLASKTNCTLP